MFGLDLPIGKQDADGPLHKFPSLSGPDVQGPNGLEEPQ